MTDRVPPNPPSPYATAHPEVRHLLPSLFGATPEPGVLALTGCDRMAVVPTEPLTEVTKLIEQGRTGAMPPGLCPSCVGAAVGEEPPADEPEIPRQECRECGSGSSQGELCALCRQALHDGWWAVRAQRPLSALGLSPRPYNALRREGVRTLGDLADHTAEDITDIRNLGVLSLAEVRTKLARFGLALKGEDPAEDPAEARS